MCNHLSDVVQPGLGFKALDVMHMRLESIIGYTIAIGATCSSEVSECASQAREQLSG